jgi:hypothetical protein
MIYKKENVLEDVLKELSIMEEIALNVQIQNVLNLFNNIGMLKKLELINIKLFYQIHL